MRKTCLFLLLLAVSLMTTATETISYCINPQSRRQVNEGWGVSLCWWANMCGKWSDEKIDELVDWMVSPTGLNWNIFRYNIGGGDDPQNAHCDPHHMGKGKGLRAEMEGFQDELGGEYHWDRDEAQRKIMLKIKEKRPDAIFEAFSNSAPWWMTYSGCCAGNVDANADNLKPEYYEAFCHYLVDVCKHYKDTYGIEFKTLEPFNEPVTNYWYANGGQEGCHVSTQAQIDILKVLSPILKESGLNTIISASDETDVAQSVKDIKEYEKQGILDLVGQWNTHTYSANNRARSQVGSLARQAGKLLWMSEVGAGGSGINGNLSLTQKMFDDIHLIIPDAWVDWQYVEENGDQWCLVNAKFSDETSAYKTRNYFVRQQVTRFIKQGYSFVTTPCDQTLAAINPAGDSLIVVLINNTSAKVTHKIQLLAGSMQGLVTQYRTSESDNLKRSFNTTCKVDDKHLSIDLPSETITTLVIKLKDVKTVSQSIQSGNTYMILPQSNLGLAVSSVSGKLVVKALDPQDPAQQWTIQQNDEGYTLTNGNQEIVTNTGSYALSTNTGEASGQTFRILEVEKYFYKILAPSANNGFDLQGNGLTDGTTIGMYGYGSSVDADTHNWYFLPVTYDDAEDAVTAIKPTMNASSNIYQLNGMKVSSPQRGINVIPQGNGTFRKVAIPSN